MADNQNKENKTSAPRQFDYGNIIQQYEDIARGYTGGLSSNVNLDPNTSGYGYGINRTGQTPSGFSGSYSTPRGNLITIGSPPVSQQQTVSRTLSAGGQQAGGGYSGGSQPYSRGYQGPMVPKPTYSAPVFKAPKDYKAPEFAPPERDEREEKRLRQEYMDPGMRQIRQSTQQSILSSRSIDNPNTRAQFIRQALQGVGTGISQVAATAGREASAEAGKRYNETLQNYYNKWTALSDESKINYEAKWKESIANYQNKVWGAQQEYVMQSALFGQMPLAMKAGEFGGGSPLGSRSGYTGGGMDYNKWYKQKYQ